MELFFKKKIELVLRMFTSEEMAVLLFKLCRRCHVKQTKRYVHGCARCYFLLSFKKHFRLFKMSLRLLHFNE